MSLTFIVNHDSFCATDSQIEKLKSVSKQWGIVLNKMNGIYQKIGNKELCINQVPIFTQAGELQVMKQRVEFFYNFIGDNFCMTENREIVMSVINAPSMDHAFEQLDNKNAEDVLKALSNGLNFFKEQVNLWVVKNNPEKEKLQQTKQTTSSGISNANSSSEHRKPEPRIIKNKPFLVKNNAIDQDKWLINQCQ